MPFGEEAEDDGGQAGAELARLAAAAAAERYSMTTMSIVSSSRMGQKAGSLLDRLSRTAGEPARDAAATTAAVVLLHARAKCAAKLIGVVEIAKREMEREGGTWYQYSGAHGALDEGDKDGSGSDGSAFEVLQGPSPRRRRRRNRVPTMTVYLSRTSLPELRALLGEQTNAPSG